MCTEGGRCGGGLRMFWNVLGLLECSGPSRMGGADREATPRLFSGHGAGLARGTPFFASFPGPQAVDGLDARQVEGAPVLLALDLDLGSQLRCPLDVHGFQEGLAARGVHQHLHGKGHSI